MINTKTLENYSTTWFVFRILLKFQTSEDCTKGYLSSHLFVVFILCYFTSHLNTDTKINLL